MSVNVYKLVKLDYVQISNDYNIINKEWITHFKTTVTTRKSMRESHMTYTCDLTQNRLELIRLVQKEKSTIKNAAKLLEIKESTAKLIISRFRTCKTVYETKMDKSKRSQEGMKSIG